MCGHGRSDCLDWALLIGIRIREALERMMRRHRGIPWRASNVYIRALGLKSCSHDGAAVGPKSEPTIFVGLDIFNAHVVDHPA